MSGIGAALMMPNIVAIIGVNFPPGRIRNLTFGCLGFGAPVGGVGGILVIGLFVHYAAWRWFFFLV
jgi:MFS family permease